jgi:hypothetical protein
MSLTSRRTILKTLAGAGAATAVSGFPFVNRLALGQQAIKLGVVVPMTGPMALEAQEMLAATQIAVEDVNAAGGVMGRKVETVIRDSEFKPEVAKARPSNHRGGEGPPRGHRRLQGIAMAEVGCKNDDRRFLARTSQIKGKMCGTSSATTTPYQTAAAAAHFVNQQKMGRGGMLNSFLAADESACSSWQTGRRGRA